METGLSDREIGLSVGSAVGAVWLAVKRATDTGLDWAAVEATPKPVERREPRVRRLSLQEHDLVPEHGVLEDEFPTASNNIGCHSARDARPGVGSDRLPDRPHS